MEKGNRPLADFNERAALLFNSSFIPEVRDAVPAPAEVSNRHLGLSGAGEDPFLVPLHAHDPEFRLEIRKVPQLLADKVRKLIEHAAVHPVIIQDLFRTMADEYCDLVRTAATGRYSPIVKRAVDDILLHLGAPLSLKQIAGRIHVHPSHLSRKFKEETGLTVTDFINRKRVEEAAACLRRGNVTVTEAAFMAGFNDLNYFGKVFKKIMSVTPSQYAGQRKK